MFKDYYKILGISPFADDTTIKRAYRKMSIKWHPDKNPDTNATAIMQDINDAYAILKDAAMRSRYNQEYKLFSEEFNIKETTSKHENSGKKEYSQSNWTYRYNVKDEELRENIKDAQKYAKELIEEFIKELKETSKRAVQGATTNALSYALGWVIAGIIITIIGCLIKAFN